MDKFMVPAIESRPCRKSKLIRHERYSGLVLMVVVVVMMVRLGGWVVTKSKVFAFHSSKVSWCSDEILCREEHVIGGRIRKLNWVADGM